jgi:hypothetical protein
MEPAYTIGSGEILSDLPVTFHPRWSIVINSSLVRHAWSHSVRFRTKLPCMPGSRRKHIGRHANCRSQWRGFLIPNPQALPLPGRPVARGGMSRRAPLRSLSPCRPDHSAEPSALRVQRRSANRRAACVSPITVQASFSPSFSFAAMTVQPPSKVHRAAKIIEVSSFNRPQDGRRSFRDVQKTGVVRG